jgi:hypothetical protein
MLLGGIMGILGKSKTVKVVLFPIQVLGKLLSAIGKFLSRDINEERKAFTKLSDFA